MLRVKREATHVDKIYGQELNRTTYNLARMNMILHDVHYADFDIRQEDTLEHPQHRELRFDAIVANPPFSAHWSASQLLMSDDRFSVYGKLAPAPRQIWPLSSTWSITLLKKARWPWYCRMACCLGVRQKATSANT
ncbi:N-6 DNA methylase [Methyloglobulus sp.]|uniref:N-6 DNA methylase n=1 Tax=Methyloglobulus sp. TaxID=2518622 RepID=UPI0032B72D58